MIGGVLQALVRDDVHTSGECSGGSICHVDKLGLREAEPIGLFVHAEPAQAASDGGELRLGAGEHTARVLHAGRGVRVELDRLEQGGGGGHLRVQRAHLGRQRVLRVGDGVYGRMHLCGHDARRRRHHALQRGRDGRWGRGLG